MNASPQADDLVARFEPLFRPRTYAVVGASASKIALANEMIRHLKNYGYDGEIYPIHPSADEIEGLPAYPSLAATPKPVDYVTIAVGANAVPDILAAADGNVKFAQVISSGFGETTAGVDLEQQLIDAGRKGGVRIIGPNCLGTYSPRGRVTFVTGSAVEPGPVGIISQSGGLAVDIILRGGAKGLRFSGLVTIGNSADLGPSELLSYYLADPETKVIGLYLEDVADGRAFFETLRSAKAAKPIVLLKGGRTAQGQRAAASHTGSLASDDRIWAGLVKQTGVALVDTLDAFLDTLLAFQMLTTRIDRPTRKVVLFGNGGGTSVLASDFFGRAGFDVPLLSDLARHNLLALKLPPGTSIDNPIDTPSTTLKVDEGRIARSILKTVYTDDDPDVVVMHINLPVFGSSQEQGADYVGILVDSALQVTREDARGCHFVLVLRSDGMEHTESRRRKERQRAMDLGIPVFDELPDAARALAGVRAYEEFLFSRGLQPKR
jgi:acyl-CoA synthetase (NDP forming)